VVGDKKFKNKKDYQYDRSSDQDRTQKRYFSVLIFEKNSAAVVEPRQSEKQQTASRGEITIASKTHTALDRPLVFAATLTMTAKASQINIRTSKSQPLNGLASLT